MSQNTQIEWTDTTWNPVRGCVKVSPGCAHCYAETFAERWRGVKGHPYEQGFDLRLVPEKLMEPLSWRKPRRVFVNSMSDLFQDGVPDEYIDRVFAVMALTPQHTYQVLTKRAERMRDYILRITYDEARSESFYEACDEVLEGGGSQAMDQDWPLPNVWLGVSVENQHFADERIQLLLQTPAAVRFISAEPLLGPVDIERYVGVLKPHEVELTGPWLDWVIAGGESGAGARDCYLEWIRALERQCAVAGVAFFLKQLGARPIQRVMYGPATFEADQPVHRERLRLRSRKGGDPAEWDEDLRVRQFPTVTA
jgi:protein gp37